jgi:hypothetical protein
MSTPDSAPSRDQLASELVAMFGPRRPGSARMLLGNVVVNATDNTSIDFNMLDGSVVTVTVMFYTAPPDPAPSPDPTPPPPPA